MRPNGAMIIIRFIPTTPEKYTQIPRDLRQENIESSAALAGETPESVRCGFPIAITVTPNARTSGFVFAGARTQTVNASGRQVPGHENSRGGANGGANCSPSAFPGVYVVLQEFPIESVC